MSDQTTAVVPPDIARLRHVASLLSNDVIRTPTVPWPASSSSGGPDMQLFVKLELLQRTGSFKARGAINSLRHAMQSSAGSFAGATAFSAGNHAIATAYAARALGTTAKVVMPRSANAFRRQRCKELGAELVYGESISDLLAIVKTIQSEEGRHLIHPFDGVHTIEGTATVGIELGDDVAQLDAVVVPVGGGGLIAGVASAIKQIQPRCQVIGVEPIGANGMQQSLRERAPKAVVSVSTIADSLGAPMHAAYSFSLIQQVVDQIVTVSDDQLREAMRRMFTDMKLAVEPACAAALAAIHGPLEKTLGGKRVAIVACGSNIDFNSYSMLLGE